MRKNNKSKRIYMFSVSLIILVVLISIAVPLKNNKDEVTQVEITKENNGLPKLKTFETLYNIMKENKDKYNIKYTEDTINEASDTKSTENKENDYSKTNNQIEGVEEADVVKTDGQFIYYITNKKVVIIEASEEMDLISEIDFTEEQYNPNELYIVEDKLIIIGSEEINNFNYNEGIKDIVYTLNGDTIAKIYNIENKEKPKIEREVKIEGNYLSSRMIADNLYFISNKTINSYKIKDNIEEENENDYKPKYKDTLISDEDKLINYSEISYFPESEELSYLSIASLNVNKNEKVNIECYLGAGQQIYCSLNNMYIAKIKYEYKDEKVYGYYNNYDINTYIYKFKLDEAKVTYQNVGTVPGKILNQFSMDEKDGYLRIATTNNKNLSNDTNVNNLYVLDQDLQTVGKIENLAKGEKIYSVRFIESRAYMVTFVETDPLFVIDLSDVTNPEVLGELKIPGYSKYLHPYDETHIIGFGENTEVNESGGVVTNGMKMALFDVTNPVSPQELFKEDIGDKGTTSQILYNHKSLLFSKEKNLIAFPIYITEQVQDEEGEGYKTNYKFQGAIVYGLDLENGFIKKGEISHQVEQEENLNFDYTKTVERIIYINNNLYTLSKGLTRHVRNKIIY